LCSCFGQQGINFTLSDNKEKERWKRGSRTSNNADIEAVSPGIVMCLLLATFLQAVSAQLCCPVAAGMLGKER
jgi:hypothetical protein